MTGIIHDFCMIPANQLLFDAIAGARINDAAINLATAVHYAAMLFKMFIFRNDMIGMLLRLCGTQFPAKIGRSGVYNQLIGGIRGIIKPIIQIIIYNRSACTKGNLPVEIKSMPS